eukprot:8320446-Alexandrium_andersonii.AAC.1
MPGARSACCSRNCPSARSTPTGAVKQRGWSTRRSTSSKRRHRDSATWASPGALAACASSVATTPHGSVAPWL